MPSMPPGIGGPFALSSAGASTTMHSDVVISELTDAASTSAVLTTFNGSMIPAQPLLSSAFHHGLALPHLREVNGLYTHERTAQMHIMMQRRSATTVLTLNIATARGMHGTREIPLTAAGDTGGGQHSEFSSQNRALMMPRGSCVVPTLGAAWGPRCNDTSGKRHVCTQPHSLAFVTAGKTRSSTHPRTRHPPRLTCS